MLRGASENEKGGSPWRSSNRTVVELDYATQEYIPLSYLVVVREERREETGWGWALGVREREREIETEREREGEGEGG